MRIAVIKETKNKECRVALTPDVAKDLVEKGFKVVLEKDAGILSYFQDEDYHNVGVEIAPSRQEMLMDADVLLAVNPPDIDIVNHLKEKSVLISFLWASYNPDLIAACESKKISVFSIDAIPRISRAQKMDALSSQSNLAGYKTVLLAANALGKIFPMLTTAAGTIRPAKVMIMGAGVAGLQAIATAKRLGAVVEVSDIRPETKEQVESLGGRFIMVDQDASVVTEGGYVKGVSDEFLKKQQELIAKHAAQSDIIITTALIPGKKAPLLITEEMVKTMKMGSVIVDMAVEQGGNCALSEVDATVIKYGVTIIGESNLPSLLPMNASQLYAKNIATFLIHLADDKGFKWELEEEITKGSLIIHEGNRVHPSVINQN